MGDAAELVAMAKSGERSAFDELVRETYADTYALAFRLTGNEDDACDVLQDAYLRAYRSLKRFRGDAAFSTWVYRLVVNCCLDHRRRSWRLIPIADDLLAVLRAPGDSLDRMLHTEMRDRVRGAVDKLPPDLRMVVVLRYTEGLSYDEIAEVLGCATGTVASRLNRAHKALERRLANV